MNNHAFSYYKITKNKNLVDATINFGVNIEFDYCSAAIDDLLNPIPSQEFLFKNNSNAKRSLKIFNDLQRILYNDGKKEYPFILNYKNYRSFQGSSQKSGAYIFRPDNYTMNGSLLYSIPRYAKVFMGVNLIQISVIN